MKTIRRTLLVASLALLASFLGAPYVRAQDECKSPCEFRFIVYGDTRSGDKIHQHLVNTLVTRNPSLLLQTGDLVRFGWVKRDWDKFERITAVIREKKIPFYPARGNHDDGLGSRYEKYVAEPFRPGGSKLNYAFDKGSLRFISLDTIHGMKVGSAQYKWLESELASAQADGKFVVPFFHLAIFSIGNHGGDENKGLRAVLHPLFKKFGVRLVFQGHDHNYYYTQRDGITYVVSGGGGAGLYKDKHKEQRIPGDEFILAYNFSVCDVYPDRVEVKTYASVAPLKKPYEQKHQFSVPLH